MSDYSRLLIILPSKSNGFLEASLSASELLRQVSRLPSSSSRPFDGVGGYETIGKSSSTRMLTLPLLRLRHSPRCSPQAVSHSHPTERHRLPCSTSRNGAISPRRPDGKRDGSGSSGRRAGNSAPRRREESRLLHVGVDVRREEGQRTAKSCVWRC